MQNLQPILPKHKPQWDVLTVQVDERLTEIRPENQVIVHCHIETSPGFLLRIWSSTYLHPNGSGGKIPLLHAENITFAPIWTEVMDYGVFRFTLIFSGLPQGCTQFDLIEDITDAYGAFTVLGIPRNETDVYSVWL